MLVKQTPDTMYHIRDLAQSPLTADIGLGASEILVQDGNRFPEQRFLARIAGEFIVFSHRVGNTLFVEEGGRGAHNTPTQTHGAGTLVSLVVAAAHIDKIKSLLLEMQDHTWGYQPPVAGFGSSPFLVEVDEGVRYIVTEGTGDWSGRDGNIAEYHDGVWHFIEPNESFFVKIDGIYHTYTTGQWIEASPVAVDDLVTDDPSRVLAASQGVVLREMIESTDQVISELGVEDISGLVDALDSLVPKEEGMGLSANSFTDELLTKLIGIADEATKNETDAFLVERANHTGTQAIRTIEGLDDELDTLFTREHNEVGGIQGGNETERFHLSAAEYQKVQTISDDLDLKVNFLDVADDLITNDPSKVLSAAQGVALKTFIDNINSLLQSDDSTLDELQEIVDFIKANRQELDNLTINNIAGLEDALSSKVDNSRVLTDVPLNATFTDTVYDDTQLAARVEGLETAGFITAEDLPAVSEAAWGGISGDITDQLDLASALNEKQDTLVSGQNIKTVNGESIIGEGDIVIQSGGLDEAQLEAFLIGLQDGTLSGNEYVVMVNREQDIVTRYSLNDLIATIVSLVDTSGGGGGGGLDFEDRQKIDSIEFGATKNETDGYLLNRANHTGTIPMSVVENLDQTLANIELGGMTAGETLRVDNIEASLDMKADLDASGKLLASQLPDISSGRKIKVANAAARLLISVHPDLTIAYQMDDGTSWAINGGDLPSIADNWTQLGSALISGVTSFNARTGNIIPQAGDYTAAMITESDLKQFVTAADKVSWNNRVSDAPFNGQIYGRRNGEWTIISGEGGGGGSLSPAKEEELLERSNHTGVQGMETITGLADALNTKADIDTVYAAPMQTSYTIRSVNSSENQVHTFLLNGKNNSYGIHAYALRMTSSPPDSYSLRTTIQPGGYYGVEIPRINGIMISGTAQGDEPHQRMTRHTEHGQTVTATTEWSATYQIWKIFSAGDTPTAETDSWASSRAPTPSDPQIVTFTIPSAVKLGSYEMRNRAASTANAVASPRTWTFEGRMGDSGNWNILHTVTDDLRNVSSQQRDYTIPESNQGMYDQYRWVITERNGTNSYTGIARMFLRTVSAKYMLKDGNTFYSISPTALGNIYEPMTTYVQHGQTVFGSTENSTTYRYWKAFQSGYATVGTDCWASSRAPTVAAPEHIGIDLGEAKFIQRYEIQNREQDTRVASPRSWMIQVRNSLLDEWITIHNVQNDTRDGLGAIRLFTIPEMGQGEWRYVRIVVTERNGDFAWLVISRFKLYGASGEELTPVSGIFGPSGITVNGTDVQSVISSGSMEALTNPYIVTDEPTTINFTIDPESEYEYSPDTKIVLANSYIRFSPPISGSYKFCYQEPDPNV